MTASFAIDLPVTILAAALAGAAALAWFLWREARGQPLFARNPDPFGPADPGALFLLAVALFVGYQYAAFFATTPGRFGGTGATAGVLGALLLAWTVHRIALRRVLRPRYDRATLAGYGLLVFWLALPAVYAVYLALGAFGVRGTQEQIVWLEERRPGWGWIALFAVVVAPVCEEIGFRGLLYPALRRLFGWRAAVVATSVLFGLIHAQGSVIAPLAVLAVFLAYLIEATGSVLPCIVAHVAFNALTVAQLLVPAP